MMKQELVSDRVSVCFSSFAVVWGNVLWDKKINLSYGWQKNHTMPIRNYFSIELNECT